MKHPVVFLAVALLLTAATAVAQPSPEAAADAFTAAIVAHDSLTAASLLAPDARILEGGRVETREQYLAHHFHSDSAFLGAMERERLAREIRTAGDAAWIMTTSRMTGTFRNRRIDSISAELLVLSRTADGWKVSAVHWSSRSAGE